LGDGGQEVEPALFTGQTDKSDELIDLKGDEMLADGELAAKQGAVV